jgi:hypothetical protein
MVKIIPKPRQVRKPKKAELPPCAKFYKSVDGIGGNIVLRGFRLGSASNERKGYFAKSRTAKQQRSFIETIVRSFLKPRLFSGVRVEMIHRGPAKLDQGNFAAAFKYVQDGIADAFEVDDGRDDFWHFTYRSERRSQHEVVLIFDDWERDAYQEPPEDSPTPVWKLGSAHDVLMSVCHGAHQSIGISLSRDENPDVEMYTSRVNLMGPRECIGLGSGIDVDGLRDLALARALQVLEGACEEIRTWRSSLRDASKNPNPKAP